MVTKNYLSTGLDAYLDFIGKQQRFLESEVGLDVE